jgi:Rieske Fe-S protein
MEVELDPELHTVPPNYGATDEQPKWRQDFPIDSVQDAYVARRDFTKFLGLTSLAFVVGQYWIAVQSRWRQARGQLPLAAIGKLDDLRVGEAKTFHYPTEADPAILLRIDEETLLAYSSQCTHLQCPVLPRMDVGQLHCPCHRGYFDMHTGQPLAGPPRRPLPRIALKVQGGIVYAAGFEGNQV